MRDFARLIAPFVRRVSNMLARGTVAGANATKKMQSLQMRLLAGEVKDDIEHFEPYGHTSNPNPGAEGIAVFFDGDRSHGVVVVVADRRYRLQGLKTGEVALHDDQGQKVHLTRNGIVIDGANLPITIQNTPHVTMTTPQVSMSGNLDVAGSIVAQGDISDYGTKSMAGMRSTYNTHTHPETAVPGPTGAPNQAM